MTLRLVLSYFSGNSEVYPCHTFISEDGSVISVRGVTANLGIIDASWSVQKTLVPNQTFDMSNLDIPPEVMSAVEQTATDGKKREFIPRPITKKKSWGTRKIDDEGWMEKESV